MDDWQKNAIEELKKKWYTMDEAIEALAENGRKITKTDFQRKMETVDFNKEIGFMGKPQIQEKKTGGRGRPRKQYNHAAVEAIRTFALSDTFKKVEEEPIDFFLNNKWRDEVSLFLDGKLREALKKMLEVRDEYKYKPDKEMDKKLIEATILGLRDETLDIVDDIIVKRYYSLAGQNKFLVGRNKRLEDTKEFFIASHSGVEERASELNRISRTIREDIEESSKLLARKEVYHFNQTMQVNQKLEKVLELLEDIKKNG